jgi:hypothetical protein
VVNVEMAVWRFAARCRVVQVYQRFRDPYCLHHQDDEKAARTRNWLEILTCSFISNRFLASDVLIALMKVAVRTSEMVNLHQSTRRYNTEDSYLHFKPNRRTVTACYEGTKVLRMRIYSISFSVVCGTVRFVFITKAEIGTYTLSHIIFRYTHCIIF